MEPKGAGRARGRGKRIGTDDAPLPVLRGAGSGVPIFPQPMVDMQSASTSSADYIPRGAISGMVRPPVPMPPLGRAQYAYASQTPTVYPPPNYNRPDTARGPLRGRREEQPKVEEKLSNIIVKTGTSGDPVTLNANYFQLLRKPTWTIYQYHVEFKPDVELAGLRRYLVATQKEMLGGYLFDGTMLFLIRHLEDGAPVVERTIQGRNGDEFLVVFKFTKVVAPTDAQSVQILNLILRRAINGLKLQLVGRNFYDADAKTPINEFKIELWPGYITSIRQHDPDILVCVEFVHKVMRMETVYDIMVRMKREEPDFKSAIERDVLGTTVLTDYNNKTYYIDDIDYTKKPSDSFETKNGPVTFIQYYQSRYNIHIKDPNQPLLVSKAKAKDLRGGQNDQILLIPELCRATGYTDKMRSDHRNMKAVSEHTRMNPGARIKRLHEFNRRLYGMKESMTAFREWDLKLDNKLVEIPGRQLPHERIVFGGDKKRPTDDRADWTNEFRSNAMFHTKDGLKRWFLVTTKRMAVQSRDFVTLMKTAARGMQFELADPKCVELENDRQNTYVDALNQCANENPQFIMCVVPNDNVDRYSNIKKKCCVDRPIPTQVILIKTITPKSGKPPSSVLSVATKVVIQINCKLGGIPWMIELPIKGLMTIGFDVCHDTKDKKKAYGALVATMDLNHSTEFFSAVTAHTKDEELCNELALNVVKAVHEYRTLHGALPARICFYRDGVGEGQVEFVKEHEVNYIRKKLEDVYELAGSKNDLKFAFIIVNKRINTRLFRREQNPNPGTVVDSVITLPDRYDFYLIPQSVRQGSVSPTSFMVVYDTMGLPADKVQILTYKMCHLYFNWTGTVRVPSVCQYAHKLAFLVSQFIHASPSQELQKQLYFL